MIAEMVECLQTVLSLGHNRNSSIPAFLTPVLKNIIISLARLPLVNSYTRVPPLVCLLCCAFRILEVIEELWKPNMVLHPKFYISRTSTLSWFDQSVCLFEHWVITCASPFLCFSTVFEGMSKHSNFFGWNFFAPSVMYQCAFSGANSMWTVFVEFHFSIISAQSLNRNMWQELTCFCI